MDDHRSHRATRDYAVETDPRTLPSWRSRTRSAGWLTVLVIGLGTMAALAIAAVVVIAWVMVSAAVT